MQHLPADRSESAGASAGVMGKVSAMMQRLFQPLAKELQSSRAPPGLAPGRARLTMSHPPQLTTVGYAQLTTTPCVTPYLSDIDGKVVN